MIEVKANGRIRKIEIKEWERETNGETRFYIKINGRDYGYFDSRGTYQGDYQTRSWNYMYECWSYSKHEVSVRYGKLPSKVKFAVAAELERVYF